MTEVMLPETIAPCPAWCVHDGPALEHAHISADVTAGSRNQTLTARLVQTEEDGAPQVLLNGRVCDLEEFGAFVSCLQRLVDQAQLAPAGCGIADDIISQAGLTLSEVAEAAGLEVSWVRAQHAGRRLLSVHQLDRLVLAAAGLAAAASVPG
jgi:hypothetical protein